MRKFNNIKRFWFGVDTLLLLAVLALLGGVWYGTHGSIKKLDGMFEPRIQTHLPSSEGHEALPSPSSVVVDGVRVSTGQPGVSAARTLERMGEDWSQAPRTLAMDLREEQAKRAFELRMAVPRGVKEENIQISAIGQVLVLRLRDELGNRTLMRQVRLPCPVGNGNGVRSMVSNDLLLVRIGVE